MTRKRETNIHKNRKTGPKKMSGEIKGRTGVKQGIKKKVERVRTENGVEDGVETKKRGERGMQSSHNTHFITSHYHSKTVIHSTLTKHNASSFQ